MKVIAVLAQKGGADKTTLSLSLAVAAAADGLTFALIDLDPQATASNWSDRRDEDTSVVISAQATRLLKILAVAPVSLQRRNPEFGRLEVEIAATNTKKHPSCVMRNTAGQALFLCR